MPKRRTASNRPPLPVPDVGAAAFEGDDVIDDIAGARAGGVAVGRAGMLALEGTPDGRGAENAAVGVTLAGDAAVAGGG